MVDLAAPAVEKKSPDGQAASNPYQFRVYALAAALISLGMPASQFGKHLAKLHAAFVKVLGEREPYHAVFDAAALSTAWTPTVQQLWKASAQQQQQQQQGVQQGSHNFVKSVAHRLHAERLLEVSPAAWQQQIVQHLLGQHTVNSSSSSSTAKHPGSSAAAAAATASSEGPPGSSHAALVADLLCDWCSQPVARQESSSTPAGPAGQPNGDAGGAGSSSSSSSSSSSKVQRLGCVSCGAAQYCSRGCADAAKKVHAANCW
jgi:hypothetical protein